MLLACFRGEGDMSGFARFTLANTVQNSLKVAVKQQ